MAKMLPALVLCACVVAACNGWPWTQCKPYWLEDDLGMCIPCYLFNPRSVKLRVRNILTEPTFEELVTLECTHSRTLFYMMQEAVEINEAFKFTATYYGKSWGFFINSINGVAGFAQNNTWWELLDGNLQRSTVGVSSYMPGAGEFLTFNFTQGY